MTKSRKRLILFFVPILLALPFLNRALFVDDHFFVEIAEWIKDNPTRPYNFPVEGVAPAENLSGKDLSLRIVNPLLHHYYLAGLMKVGGDQEWFLRFGCLLFSCFSALLLFELARRWLDHPFLATLLVLVTPAFLVSSYSLLIDPTLLFFMLLALYAFVRATEEDHVYWVLLSGVAMGLGLLTKYTAFLILPVSLTWLYLNRSQIRRPWLMFLPSFIALVLLAIYVGATRAIYGAGHLFAASHESLTGFSAGKILVLMVFLSGGAIAPVLVWGAGKVRQLMVAALAFVIGSSFLASSLGGFSWGQSIFMSFFLTTSFALLLCFFSVRQLWRPKVDAFLFLWMLGYLVMMIFVMPWVAVRYLLIGLPPLVFCSVRLLEINRPTWTFSLLWSGIVLSGIMGLLIGTADYYQAESSRYVVAELRKQNLLEGTRNYYFSDAFTMTYLRKAGWKPSGNPSELKPGDRIIASEVTFPLFWFFRTRPSVRVVTSIEMPSHFPLKVMDSAGGAGFYGSAWGPLPYSFSTGPWERFDLFEIINPS